MAIFLNRDGILTHFERILEEAIEELIMIVPFIKLTSEIIDQFKKAETRGVEILIVYRENTLSKEQKDILFSFGNVTILHHPNVHAKCYLNERSLIICSMNLYDVSMKNNREMGVLLDYFYKNLESEQNKNEFDFSNIDDSIALEAAIEEIKIILNSSTIEKSSAKVIQHKFNFNILKNREEIGLELIENINKETANKKFKLIKNEKDVKNVICANYYENIDVELEIVIYFNENNLKSAYVKRVFMHLKHPEIQKKKIYYNIKIEEYSYKYYKTYWNWHESPIIIYRDSKYNEVWERGTDIEHVIGLLKCADKILFDLKKDKAFNQIST